ncbi:cell division cycle protein 20 homolog [Rhopilema esculentum]|uniref:cell division cycle protein 20 homolog n=1 Tax=Rhopilema esculentum TaxID=499914 RepID=UPI0031E3685A|eukprot:gene4471-20716_t
MFDTPIKFCQSAVNTTTPRMQRRTNYETSKPTENIHRTPTSSSRMKTPSKTPGSCPRTPKTRTPCKYATSADRFIANRMKTDLDQAHFKLLHESESDNASPSKLAEEKLFKENLRPGSSTSKILSFNVKIPGTNAGLNARQQYSSSLTPNPKKPKSRNIPQAPERILDAPDYVNDYYLNLLDWGNSSLLAVALSQSVYIWDSKTGKIVHLCQLESANDYVSSLKWEKNNGYLAVGTSDSHVELWDIERTKRLRQLHGHISRVGSLSWNSHLLSSGCRSGTIHQHDVRIPQHHVGSLAKHTQEVCGLEWSPDGKYLASGGNDNVVNIWDATMLRTRDPMHCLARHTAGVKALAWCPWQSSLLASGGGSADRCIRFWNVNTGECVNTLDTKSQICGLIWSKRYKEIVSGHGYSQNQLTVWKYPSLKRTADLTGHTGRILQLTMSPDETYVMSAAADETLRLWKLFPPNETKKEVSSKDNESLSVFKFR